MVITESGGVRNEKGGWRISIGGVDGCFFGGCLAGRLIAASPVQVRKRKKTSLCYLCSSQCLKQTSIIFLSYELLIHYFAGCHWKFLAVDRESVSEEELWVRICGGYTHNTKHIGFHIHRTSPSTRNEKPFSLFKPRMVRVGTLT